MELVVWFRGVGHGYNFSIIITNCYATAIAFSIEKRMLTVFKVSVP